MQKERRMSVVGAVLQPRLRRRLAQYPLLQSVKMVLVIERVEENALETKLQEIWKI